MADKTTTLDAAVAEIESGMTIGIGGWGSRRKPMAFVRALLRTDVTDLTVVTYGGPDLGLLCAAGKVKRVYYGFVSLDSPPFYDPWFARRRLLMQIGSAAAVLILVTTVILKLPSSSSGPAASPTTTSCGRPTRPA